MVVASLPGYDVLRQQLIDAGVEPYRINRTFIDTKVNARLNFLRDYASLPVADADGLSIAEGGVFQGEFAKEMNRCFPESTLYLFDTFEGFDSRDVAVEHESRFSIEQAGHLSITSEKIVLEKLPHREKAVVRKGYFPETAAGLERERFRFVNLDFDLYAPTLAGVTFFYPRIIRGGALLIHDFFSPAYKGVAQAVFDAERELGAFLKIPIGDRCSIAIVKC